MTDPLSETKMFQNETLGVPYGLDQLPDQEKLSRREQLTLIKIMLKTASIEPTDQNLALAAEYTRSLNKSVNDVRTCSDSERRKYIKEIRHYIRKAAKREETNFMQRATIRQGDSLDKLVGALGGVSHEKIKDIINNDKFVSTDLSEMTERLTKGIIFERPQGTSVHHFLDHLKIFTKKEGPVFDLFKNDFQSFVIEHDWAKAFEGVKDFDGGEIKLPFAYTVFEFRISGVRVLVFLGEMVDGKIGGVIASGINKRWYVNPAACCFDGQRLYHPSHPDNTLDPIILTFLKALGAQIRAVCIMLDAEVAVGEKRTLAREGIQKKRQAEGKSPLRDYHVVSLTKKFHERDPESDSTPTGVRRRLHWRRGHWRHFSTPGGEVRYSNDAGITVSKTWIKWMLVGSEDLGFVDKHYKF